MNRSQLYLDVTKLISGLVKHSQALTITRVTAAQLQAALDDAATKETLFQTARNNRQAATTAQGAAREAARAFVTKARDALRPYLGTNWSISWAQAGFKSDSLKVPNTLPELRELLRGLKAYWTANPTHQNTAIPLTAAKAEEHRGNLDVAIETVQACRQDQRTRRDLRQAAEAALEEKVGVLESELEAALKPADPRWLDFVDQIPADARRPEPVTGVRVEGDGPGQLAVAWDRSVRAKRFHIEVLEIGLDTEFRRVLTARDASADVEGLTPGAQVKVRLVASNYAGEAAPSEPVLTTVPPLANAA